MPSDPSWQDFYDLGKATLQSRRPKLVVIEGDVTDAILAGAATMASMIVARDSQQFRSTFLDGASGDDLTARCRDRGVERNTGEFAIGYVDLSRVSFAAGAGTQDAGDRVATVVDSDGNFQIYTLDDDVVWGATDLTKLSVAVTCTTIGRAGNVDEGEISRFLDAPFDTTITVTNSDRMAGGEEEESDEDLRDRTRGFFLTQARGTIDALKYGARLAGAPRVSISVDGSGVVTVYVADAEGNSNAALVDAVETELENWRDAADVIYVTGGVILEQDVTVALNVRTGTSVAALVDRVRAAIESRIGRLNPGETLYVDMISAAARDVDRENIISVSVTLPLVSLTPDANEVIRAGTVSVTG